MKKLDHFDMRVLNSSPLLLPADGLKPGDKNLDLPFCLMRAARKAIDKAGSADTLPCPQHTTGYGV